MCSLAGDARDGTTKWVVGGRWEGVGRAAEGVVGCTAAEGVVNWAFDAHGGDCGSPENGQTLTGLQGLGKENRYDKGKRLDFVPRQTVSDISLCGTCNARYWVNDDNTWIADWPSEIRYSKVQVLTPCEHQRPVFYTSSVASGPYSPRAYK